MATATAFKVESPLTDSEFDQLFRAHYPMVYRTAFSVTRSAEDAEDVLQTVFLRLLGREFPAELKKNAKSYLYRAAFNASLDILRSRRRSAVLSDGRRVESAV